jgi:hypothetical protein
MISKFQLNNSNYNLISKQEFLIENWYVAWCKMYNV